MITPQHRADPRAVDGRRVVAVLGGAMLVALLVWFVVAMPGMDHSSTPGANGMPDTPGTGVDHTMITDGPLRRLAPAEFDERLSDQAVTVVNVHVPYDGELAGTHAFVEFDQIVGDPAIPADRAAPILLYCRSGRMSRIAGEALIAAGYQDVVDLDGGMDAWEATGRPIVRDSRNA